MKIKQNVNIHNRFDIHVDNIKTGEHREYVGYNIILDRMWTRLCAGDGYFSNIHFGSGSGTPTPDRTSLFSLLGTKSAVTEETIKAFPVSSWKRKIVLNPEEYVGSTISEVGIAYGNGATNLVTHAMLRDSEGNPISITKTDTDVVTIYATVFITLTNTIPELKFIGIPNNNQLINYLTGGSAPSGSFSLSVIENPLSRLGTTSLASWTSDVPNRKRKVNTSRFGTTSGNGHVKYLEFSNLFKLELPAPGIFSGQSYTGVHIGSGDGVKKSFILPSANIRQNSLVIKKNGVVVSDYIVNIKNLESNSRIATPASVPSSDGNGVALNYNGTVMAVAHRNLPYVATYDWNGTEWIRRPDPASLPPDSGQDVALTPDGNLLAVAHWGSPSVTTYDWNGTEWIKRPDPASLPTGNVTGIALTHDGTVMAVAHTSSPRITTYDWIDGEWVKRPNPASLPTGTARGVALNYNGTIMAVAHDNSPYVTTYDWNGTEWIKRPDPASLPTGLGRGVALTPDGNLMAVAHESSPYVTTYDWIDGEWVKRPDPESLPTGNGYGVALTPDGTIMVVGHRGAPYIATYVWLNGEWVKRPGPASFPSTDYGPEVAISSDGTIIAMVLDDSPRIATYMGLPFTQITFNTPPALGDVITADYIVDGVHKTDQYVIDVSFAIQFGEGV